MLIDSGRNAQESKETFLTLDRDHFGSVLYRLTIYYSAIPLEVAMKTHALQKGVVWLFSVAAILVFNGLLFTATAAGEHDPIPMKAESETQFFDSRNDIQVVFVKDANGQISEMTLRLSGREFRAKKIK